MEVFHVQGVHEAALPPPPTNSAQQRPHHSAINKTTVKEEIILSRSNHGNVAMNLLLSVSFVMNQKKKKIVEHWL